ncbi:MAG: hypothetical protein MZW92_68035 [Comamonadaceae bacterium]|nr:hypothetical protein [Comamonadaceae bacterium]
MSNRTRSSPRYSRRRTGAPGLVHAGRDQGADGGTTWPGAHSPGGEKASQVLRLLKSTLEEHRRARLRRHRGEHREQHPGDHALQAEEMEIALEAKQAAQQELEARGSALAMLNAERNAGVQTEQRRAALAARVIGREAAAKASRRSSRTTQGKVRIKKAGADHGRSEGRWRTDGDPGIARTREEARGVLAQKPAIEAAITRLPAIEAEAAWLGGAALEAAQAGPAPGA